VVSGARRLTVTVDPGARCGVGRCAATEPRVFDQDPAAGTVVLLDRTPAPPLRESVLLCAELCPCQAISVTVVEERE
jgi:ferredoxin